MVLKAVETLTEARNTFAQTTGPASIQYVNCTVSLACAYAEIGQDLRALDMLFEAQKTVQGKGNRTRDAAIILQLIGRTLSIARVFDKAEPMLRESLAILREIGEEETLNYAITQTTLNYLLVQEGSLEEAAQTQPSILLMLDRFVGPDHPQYVFVRDVLCSIYLRQGRIKEVLALQTASLKQVIRVKGRKSLHYARALEGLGNTILRSGRTKQGRSVIKRSLQLSADIEASLLVGVSMQSIHDVLNHFYGALASLLTTCPPDGPEVSATLDWVLRQRGVLFVILSLRQKALEDAGGNPELDTILSELNETRQQISMLAAKLSLQQNEKEHIDMKGIEKEALRLRMLSEILEERIQSILKPDRFDDNSMTTDSVQERLPADAALLEFVRYFPVDFETTSYVDPRYAVFVLCSSGTPHMIDLGDANEINGFIEQFHWALRTHSRQFFACAEKLYSLLISPVLPFLAKVNTLFISPDGDLHRLPFAALKDPSGRYLLQTYRIGYLSSGRDLLRPVQEEKGEGVMIFSSPEYGPLNGPESIWEPLPGSLEEGQEAERIFSDGLFGEVYHFHGEHATKANLRTVRSPRLLLISTHGYFRPNLTTLLHAGTPDGVAPTLADAYLGLASPMVRSGLVLANANRAAVAELDDTNGAEGWLTAEEVRSMELRGTPLVVLSACETGVGQANDQGVFGLRFAFLQAGARALACSLYDIPDRESADLMSRFLVGVRQGKGGIDALRDAQLKLLENPETSHPDYWAAFVLIGEVPAGEMGLM